jgi:2-keto-4-pentenoate hydratase/2-oxohepta-3-ene-1,7-dioic acid hydratase in catechol pathway
MKIFCIGRNYAKHAKELGNKVPSKPLIFMKPPSALLVNDKPLYYPEFTKDLHYEAEIVFRITKNGRHVQKEFAHKYYDQIAFGIDFTARDLQNQLKEKGHPWEIAKGFDNSAAVSPFVNISSLNSEEILFTLKKNGEIVQSGNTKDLIFDIETLICYISSFFKLQVGDYIFTGTPEGVGSLKIGDLLEGYLEDKKVLECSIK